MLGDSAAGIRAVLFDFDDTLQGPVGGLSINLRLFSWTNIFPICPGKRKPAGESRCGSGTMGDMSIISTISPLSWRAGAGEGAPEVGDLYREFQFRFPECSTLFPETKEVLTELRRRGFLLGIVTNGPSIQQNRKLDVAGLRPFVDLCMVSGDEQVHKPTPKYRRAASPSGGGLPGAACMWGIIRSTT